MANVIGYKRWLASGETKNQVLETLDIYHPAWGHTRVVNNDRDVVCTLENGNNRKFFAGRFYMEPAEINDTTSQATTVAVSSLDGRLYDKVKTLNFEDRKKPITATYRLFWLNNPANPLVNPPPVWTVHSMNPTREAISVELRSEALRVQKIGLYYTENEFPALVYI